MGGGGSRVLPSVYWHLFSPKRHSQNKISAPPTTFFLVPPFSKESPTSDFFLLFQMETKKDSSLHAWAVALRIRNDCD